MNQPKELFFTEMNLFKNELLTSLKHNNRSLSQETSNNTNNFPATRSNRISAGTAKIQK